MNTEQFYKDFSLWLGQRIKANVKNENDIPFDLSLERLKIIVISSFFSFIYSQKWSAPQQKTADIFELSTRTVARAIRKHSK